jgi:uncharacterized protein Yka (UPF0111/DUF47 family)
MIDDVEIFPGKSMANLFQEIYDNSTGKRNQITDLVNSLQKMVNNSNDALVIVPLIKEYLDVAVKNDEQLIKLATVVQKIVSAKALAASQGMDTLLSDAEKTQLLLDVKDLEDEMRIEDKKLKQLTATTIDKINA